jgi:type II secretory pathway pseudopilin PulG
MKLMLSKSTRGQRQQAFSLVETLVGFGVTGIVASSLFFSFALGFNVIKASRENARATQVLMEKIEVFRLYSWTQVTNTSFVPTSFMAPFVINSDAPGFYYTGTVSIATAPLNVSYNDDMRHVTVSVDWSSSGVVRHRELSTYVSRYGIQNYTY